MSQVVVPTIPTPIKNANNWQRIDLERGRIDPAMQITESNLRRRWQRSVSEAPRPVLRMLEAPASWGAHEQAISHRVGDGHSFAKYGAMFFGLMGFCCGYGFSTMAGEQLLLSVPSKPFNTAGDGRRTLATALVGFNLPLGIAGLAVGALVGAGLGAMIDACVES